MRHATCCFGVRLTLTGFAPFGSFTMCGALSVCSPGRNRFVFVSVPRVSSFSNALLPNRLTSGFDGLRESLLRQSHLLADPLRGFVRVLVILHNDLRDLSEVRHLFLDHVLDNVDSAGELRLHLFVGHVLHFHDLVEQERVSLVDEGVRRGVPFVHRVRDQLVRLRFKPTSSTTCLIRRTIESPIRACVWMTTKFRAVSRMRGVLIGGFSRRLTMDFTESACMVDIVGCPVAMAWNIV